MTATPNAGAAFTGFGGALTGTTTPQPLTVDADKTVSAGFVAQYSLAVAASGPGSVTLSPPGGLYDEGTSVTVTAVPDLDAAFLGFSGGLTGTTNPQVVVMNANTSATATFATLFDVAASATGPGTIALDPPGGTYPAGTVVTVTATPDAGAAFTGFAFGFARSALAFAVGLAFAAAVTGRAGHQFLAGDFAVVVFVEAFEGHAGVRDFGRVNLAVFVGVERADERRGHVGASAFPFVFSAGAAFGWFGEREAGRCGECDARRGCRVFQDHGCFAFLCGLRLLVRAGPARAVPSHEENEHPPR